jgi:hypothetical protein
VIVAEPKPGLPKIVQLRSNGRNQALLFREAVHTGSPNDIQPERYGTLNGIAIVQEQTFRLERNSQGESFTLSSVQASFAKFLCLRSIFQGVNVNPFPLSRYNLGGNWELRAANGDLFEDCTWNRDLIEKHAKQFEIAERGKVYQWTTVGDDQARLPVPASSFELFNGLAVRFPVLDSINNVRDAALLEQFHELEPAQTEFASRLARGNLAVGKKGKDRFLANPLLKLVLVDGSLGDVDFNLELHERSSQTILPL